ncbi:MAG: hypothetical protein HZC24_07920 [Rhodocyclales bacterium]|nr:hypothetical protein [Rhodocyclales bacterium]
MKASAATLAAIWCAPDTDEGEGGDVGEKGHADRQAQPQQRGDGGAVGRGERRAEAEFAVGRLRQHPAPGQRRRRPSDERGRHGGARPAQRRHAEAAVHEQQIQRQFEQQREEIEHHHRPRPADAVRQAIEEAKGEGRRHAPGRSVEISAHLRLDRRLQFRECDEGLGKTQQQDGDEGERQRHPGALMDLAPDRVRAPGAVQMRHQRRHCQQHAHQRHVHRDLDRGADAHRRQVDRRQPTRHGGIDGAVRHHRQLGDKDRPGQPREFAARRGRNAHECSAMPRSPMVMRAAAIPA